MPFTGIPDTYKHFATGPTLVRFGTYYDLGYSEDRIQISEKPFWHDVKSDGYGGSEGPPCDVQYLGAVAFVTCLLNRFNEEYIRKLAKIQIDGVQLANGIMLPTGQYMRQDAGMDKLELVNKTYTLTYEKAFLRQGRQFSVGTRHQAVALMFECHVDNPCDANLFAYDDDDDPCS